MERTPVLKISGLTKHYGKIKALDGIDFEVQQGMVFGILGPNGSGKTTTLGILLGVLQADSGYFSWFNNGMADENRKRIGALLETPNFYPYLNAIENLTIVAKIKDMTDPTERIETVLKQVSLYQRRASEFRTYSLGMKQRLAIASALLSDPEVLVLDEPTNGLDPQGIAEIRSLINTISNDGKTILIASHQLDEIEKVCTDVAILKFGKMLHTSAIGDLGDKGRKISLKSDNIDGLKSVIDQLNDVKIISSKSTEIVLEAGQAVSPAHINQFCFDNGIVLSELKVSERSLEEQFLEIVKR